MDGILPSTVRLILALHHLKIYQQTWVKIKQVNEAFYLVKHHHNPNSTPYRTQAFSKLYFDGREFYIIQISHGMVRYTLSYKF